MANRKTCLWCRGLVREEDARRLPIFHLLCPEHKRLRNRMQRIEARAARAADLAAHDWVLEAGRWIGFVRPSRDGFA